MLLKTRRIVITFSVITAVLIAPLFLLGFFSAKASKGMTAPSPAVFDSMLGPKVGETYTPELHSALLAYVRNDGKFVSTAKTGIETLASLMMQISGLAMIFAFLSIFLLLRAGPEMKPD